MSVDVLLSRLEAVKKRTPDQWSAKCPAHADNGPSLSVRDLPDGRVLLHCFAGCDVADIVAAIGLDMSELFPSKPRAGAGYAPLARRHLIGATQALEVLHFESQLVALAASNIANGVVLTDQDLDRLLDAAGRISSIFEEFNS